LIRDLNRIAPHCRFTALYGSTEAEPIARLEGEDALSWAERSWAGRDYQPGVGLPAGRVVDGIELRVLRDQWGQAMTAQTEASFEKLVQPAGQAGEIVVAGAHVLSGYEQGVGDRETKFEVEGRRWHRTGDAGYLDGSGSLWLLGRCAAKVEDARGVLYPLGIEAVVMQWPGVRRVALMSLDGRRLVVVEGGVGAAGEFPPDMPARARALGVDEMRWVARIPMDARHRSKIDYPALRAKLRA
jgi:acyl-CoA synthetase (AMP-forming)/AMP-acid ligase II